MARSRGIQIPVSATWDGAALRKGAAEVERLAKVLRALGSMKGGDPFAQTAKGARSAGDAAKKAERDMLSLARAQAAAAKEAGNTAQAAEILKRALGGITQETTATVNAQRQLNRYMRELEQGANGAAGSLQVLPRTINGLSGAAAQFAQVAAGAFAVDQIAQFGMEAISTANRLEDAKTALAAIAGDTSTYNEALGAAQRAQMLFGGSLAENVEELTSFVISSRSAGVSMTQLIDVSQRLATLDPGQGLRGANVALRELLSGNPASLAMRFELPRQTLKLLGDESLSSADKLTALSGFLDSVGITAEAVTAKTANTSQAYRDLGAAADALKASVGSLLAEALAPAATALGNAANWVAGGLQALQGFGAAIDQASANALAGAASYEEYQARLAMVREELAAAGWEGYADDILTLTEAQYEWAQSLIAGGMEAGAAYAAVEGLSTVQQAYAESLMASGMSQEQATAAAREYGSALDAVNSVQGKLWDDAGASSDQLAHLGDAMLEVASASDEGRARIEELSAQYLNGEISSNQLEDAVLNLQVAQEQAAMAADIEAANQAIASEEKANAEANSLALADSLAAQAQATDDSTMAAAAQKAALEAAAQAAQDAANDGMGLEAQARLAAAALLDAGAAGAGAAAQLAGSSADVDVLTAAYYRLEAARRAAGGTGAASALGNVGAGGRGGGKGTPATPNTAKGAAGTLPPPSSGRGGGGGGGGRRGGGGGGSARASEAQRANERLAEIAADGARRIEEINAETAAKLVEIDRQAAEERARIAKELNESLQTDAAQGLAEREANDLDLVGADEDDLKKLQAREKAEMEAAKRMEEAQAQARDRIAAGEAEAAAAQYEAQKQYIEQRQALDEQYYEKQAELAGNADALAELDTQYQEAVTALDEANRVEQELRAAQAAEKAQAAQDEKAAVIAAAEEQKAEVVAKAQEQAAGVKGASEAQRNAVTSDLAAQAQAATDWASATEQAAARAAEAYRKAAQAAASVPGPGGASGPSPDTGGATKAAGGGNFVTSGPTTLTVGDNPGGVELVQVTPLSGKGSTRVGGNMARMAGGGSLLTGMPDLSSLGKADKLLQEVARLASASGGAADQIAAYAAAITALLDVMDGLRDLNAAPSLAPIRPAAVRAAAKQASQVASIVSRELKPATEEQAEGLARSFEAVRGAVDLLLSQRDLGEELAGLRPPLSMRVVQGLATEAKRVAQAMLAQVVPLTEVQAEQAARFAELVSGVVDTLTAVFGLGDTLSGYREPIPVAVVQRLAADAVSVVRLFRSTLLPSTERQLEDVERYAAMVEAAIAGLSGVLDLRERIDAASLGGLIAEGALRLIATDALRVTQIFREVVLPLTEQQAADIGRYGDAVRAGVEALLQVFALRDRVEVGGLEPLITEGALMLVATDALRVARVMREVLLPYTEQQVGDTQRYAEVVRTGVETLLQVFELRDRIEAAGGLRPIITDDAVRRLAMESQMAAVAFRQTILPYTQQMVEDTSRYADVVSSAVAGLNDTLSLREALAKPSPPIREEDVRRLASEARRVAELFTGSLLPTTEEQADAAGRYADVVSSATGAISDTLGLTAGLFADYVSPSDAQISRVVADARRIAAAFERAAASLGDPAGAGALADAATSAVTAARESLLTMQAINDQTFTLDLGKLAQFEAGSLRLYDTLRRLGESAAAIPGLDAITGAAEAASATAAALTAMAAVPLGSLGTPVAAAAAPAGGTSGPVTVNVTNYITAPAGVNVERLAAQVSEMTIAKIDSRVRGRRS